MEKDYWFVRKEYGWGWTPNNGKGWLVVLAFIICVGVYPALAEMGYFEFSIPVFALIDALLVAVVIAICYKKGEKPSWNWGD